MHTVASPKEQSMKVNSEMQTEKFITPIAHALHGQEVLWDDINGMRQVTRFAADEVELARKAVLGLADASALRKFGVKGANAAQWLQQQGLVIPEAANRWVSTQDGCLILRLGNTEFLLEDTAGVGLCERLSLAFSAQPGLTLVPHVEASFVLSGSALHQLFSEVCSIDLTRVALGEKDVVMTQFAGVSVVLMHQDLEEESLFRLWCDSSYGPYMWEVIAGIAHEHSGGPVGIGRYFSAYK